MAAVMDKPLKAYIVHDGDDRTEVEFATNSAAARRLGANAMDCGFSDVESCRRAPHFDHFTPGPVPPDALIDDGWQYECHHCCRMVTSSLHEDIEGDDDFGYLDPDDFAVTVRGQFVFCSKTCLAEFDAEARGNVAAQAALYELVTAKYPGITVTSIYVYGDRLRKDKDMCSALARFLFPGGQHDAEYRFLDGVFVSRFDVDAFNFAYPKD